MVVFWLIALMMEAARTSEELVNFYQTTRRYNPEDSHLRTHRRENLKSYNVNSSFKILSRVHSKVALKTESNLEVYRGQSI
jgi:hypothetical protein